MAKLKPDLVVICRYDPVGMEDGDIKEWKRRTDGKAPGNMRLFI